MIKKVTYKEQVYQYLKRAIIDGTIKAGTIYSEQMIADRLQVSRTPVREAILQLRNEMLVEVYNNRGFGVRPVSPEDIRQIIQARIAIESYSLCRLAKGIHTPEGQKALTEMEHCLKDKMANLSQGDDHYQFMQADMEFHEISILFTNNVYFTGMHRMMQAQLERVTVSSLLDRGRHIAALQEHEAIFWELQKGNSEGAVSALEHHMKRTEELLGSRMVDAGTKEYGG